MRGWSSILVGCLLLVATYWSFAWGGFGPATWMCGAAGAFLIVRGVQGLAVGESGDPTALIDFASDPAGAIVDTATERLGEWFNDKVAKPAAVAEETKFDPDAAIARYLAQRGTEPAAEQSAANFAPSRGFGRKGV